MSLVASVAGFNTDSYVSVAEADSYFRKRHGAGDWFSLSAEEKESLLALAARDIDIGNYYGEKYYDNQTLQFPRDDHDTVEGYCASCESRRFKNSNLKSTTYGEIPINYWKYGSVHFTSATLINDIVQVASSDTNGFVYGGFNATPTTTTAFIVFAPIDKDIKDANCEQAYAKMEHELETYAEMKALGIQDITIGDVSVRPQSPYAKHPAYTPVMCLRAKKLMSRYFIEGFKLARA